MKLERVYLEGYGRLRGFELDFPAGLSVIFGRNETGKSTLLSALGALLFGSSANPDGKQRRRDELVDPYEPWDGGPWRGSLRFSLEAEGAPALVNVTRDFTEWECELVDADGNDLVPQWGGSGRLKGEPQFARQMLGIDRAFFRASAWLRQGGLWDHQTPDLGHALSRGLEAILSSSTTGEGATAGEAIKALQTLDKEAIGIRRKGGVKPLQRTLDALEELERQRDELAEWMESEHATIAEIEHLDERLPELAKEREQALSRLKELDEAEPASDVERLSPEWVEMATRQVQGLREARQRVAELEELREGFATKRAGLEEKIAARARFEPYVNRTDEIFYDDKEGQRGREEAAKKSEEITALKGRKHNAAFAVPAGIGAGLGAVLAAALWVGREDAVTGIVLFAVCFVAGAAVGWFHRQRQHGDDENARLRLEHERDKLLEKDKEVRELYAKLGVANYFELKTEAEQLEKDRGELARIDSEKESQERRLADEKKRLAEREEALRTEAVKAGLLESGEAVDAAKVEAWIEQWRRACDEREAAREAARKEAEAAKYEYEKARSERDALGKRTVRPVEKSLKELDEDIAVLKKRVEFLEEEKKVLAETWEWLAEVQHRYTQGEHGRAITRRINEVATRIFGEARGIAFELSEKMELRAREGETLRKIEDFSHGTRELLYLLLRVAVAEFVAGRSEPLPMILDDPFVHIDEARRRELWRELAGISQDRQVIVFTCHRTQLDEARQAMNGAGVEMVDPFEVLR